MPALYWLLAIVADSRAALTASSCTAASCARSDSAARLSSTSWKPVSTVGAVVGDGLVVGRDRLRLLRLPQAGVEDRLRERRRRSTSSGSAATAGCRSTELCTPPVGATATAPERTPPARRRSARWRSPSRRSAAAMSGRRSSSSDGTRDRDVAETRRRAGCGAIESSDGGLPISTAIACSSCARWTVASSTCACVDASCASACATSPRATMPAAYWLRVSCSERS